MQVKFSGKVLDTANYTEDDVQLVASNLTNDALSQEKIEELQNFLKEIDYEVHGRCPRCGEQKLDIVRPARNALSRRDNSTLVCSDCGNEEAFEDIGVIPRKTLAESN